MQNEQELMWGSITKLIDEISVILVGLKNAEDLENMLSDIIVQEQDKPIDYIFFSLYHYLFRLKYRLRGFSDQTSLKMDIVSKTTDRVKGDAIEYYRFTNYSYKTFLQAKKLGAEDLITNNWLLIPVDKFNQQQQAILNRMAEEHYRKIK